MVEMEKEEIKYQKVKKWLKGEKEGKGGIYNLVKKRGD